MGLLVDFNHRHCVHDPFGRNKQVITGHHTNRHECHGFNQGAVSINKQAIKGRCIVLDFHLAMLRHSCMLSWFKVQPHFPSEVVEEMNIWRNHHNLMNIIMWPPICIIGYAARLLCHIWKGAHLFDLGEMDTSKYGHLRLPLFSSD